LYTDSTNHREITVVIEEVLLLQSTMQQERMLEGGRTDNHSDSKICNY